MCLEMGAVETLIVWESLDCDRYELLGPGGKQDIKFLSAEQVRARVCVCAGCVWRHVAHARIGDVLGSAPSGKGAPV